MKVTRQEESSIGSLHFCGEDFFFVYLKDIPRERKIIDLTNELINKKNIKEPEKENVRNIILEKAPEFKARNLALFFFNLRSIDRRGSILAEVEVLYESNQLKGDPLALVHLNDLDLDSSFIKKYPHMALFENDGEVYCLAYYFSETKSIEGFNLSVASARRQSGYFPSEFWFCGIVEEIK